MYRVFKVVKKYIPEVTLEHKIRNWEEASHVDT